MEPIDIIAMEFMPEKVDFIVNQVLLLGFEFIPATTLFIGLPRILPGLAAGPMAAGMGSVVVGTGIIAATIFSVPLIVDALLKKNFQIIRLDLPPGSYIFQLEGVVKVTKKIAWTTCIDPKAYGKPLLIKKKKLVKGIDFSKEGDYIVTPENNIMINGENWCYSKLTVRCTSGPIPEVPKGKKLPPSSFPSAGPLVGQKVSATVGKVDKCTRHFWHVFAEKDPKGKLVLRAKWEGNFFDELRPIPGIPFGYVLHGIDLMKDLLNYDGLYKFTMSQTGFAKVLGVVLTFGKAKTKSEWQVRIKNNRVEEIIPGKGTSEQDFLNFDFARFKKSVAAREPNRRKQDKARDEKMAAARKEKDPEKKAELEQIGEFLLDQLNNPENPWNDLIYYTDEIDPDKIDERISKLPLGEKFLVAHKPLGRELLKAYRREAKASDDYPIIYNDKAGSFSKLTVKALSGPLKGQKGSDQLTKFLQGNIFAVGIIKCPLSGVKPKLFVKVIK